MHEQFLQPDDLSAKQVQLLVLDLPYPLVAEENFAQFDDESGRFCHGHLTAPTADRVAAKVQKRECPMPTSMKRK